MSLTSLGYLAFLTICVLLNKLLPKGYSNFFLLLSSIAFYVYAMPGNALIMMIYVLIIFMLGTMTIDATKSFKKYLMQLGIFISVVFLFIYKYLNFTIGLFGVDKRFSLIAPIGISYVTFSCISYLVEIYKGKIRAVKSPIDFFLYAMFFAKITAGPIEPPETFFKALKTKDSISWKIYLNGIIMIAMGFIKKIVIADTLGRGVNAVFDSQVGFDGFTTIVAIVMYSMQIYYDFSGYTDIARGSALMFGILMTQNFKKPYAATSVRDFWRRWHISLSEWLKKYVYFTIGGSRVSTARRYLNILITFLVSGIWHGAAFTFIFWGVLHGIYQMFEILLEPTENRVLDSLGLTKESKIFVYLARVRTFICVSIGWVFFRATTVGGAFRILGNIFKPYAGIKTVMDNVLLDVKSIIMIAVSLLIVKFMRKRCLGYKVSDGQVICFSILAVWLVIIALIFAAGTGGGSSFIYFDF